MNCCRKLPLVGDYHEKLQPPGSYVTSIGDCPADKLKGHVYPALVYREFPIHSKKPEVSILLGIEVEFILTLTTQPSREMNYCDEIDRESEAFHAGTQQA